MEYDDEFKGQGGSYTVVDGKRVLVERTKGADDPEHEANKKQPETSARRRKE
jgi:hypothetical protein